MSSERQRRAGVMRQFEIQMPKYPLKILKRLTNFKYLMFEEEKEIEMLTTVLVSSFDFYELRMNIQRYGVALVVVQRHDACVPLWCLELDSGVLYAPASTPTDIARPDDQIQRRNKDEMHLFLSELITGTERAYQELRDMPERTRKRYLALREKYLLPKVGRPWSS